MMNTVLYILTILIELGIIPVAFLVYKKKLPYTKGLFLGAFLFVASFGLQVYYSNNLAGYSIIDSTINTVFDDYKALIGQMPGITAEEITTLNQLVEGIKNAYFTLFPSIIVCTYLCSSFVMLLIAKGLLALFKKDVSGFGRFCDFKMTRTGVVVALISLAVDSVFGGSIINYAFLNLASIILFACFVCGFSVLDFKLRGKIKSSILRFLIYLIVIFLTGFGFGLGMVLLTLLGIADAFMNFRKPRIIIEK